MTANQEKGPSKGEEARVVMQVQGAEQKGAHIHMAAVRAAVVQ